MKLNDWKITKLGDILTLNYGKGLPEKKRVQGGIPVYSSAGITGWHNESLVSEPGLIIGRKGTVGSVYFSKKPFYCIDTAYYLTKEDTSQDLLYVYYLLKYLPLTKLNTDSAVPGLNRENAYSQKFSLPPMEEQKKIAQILSNLDEKININNKIIRKLEGVSHAIFKRWFVDFGFPNKNDESYKANGGEMVESELGMIPKGWSVETLDKIVDLSTKSVNPQKHPDRLFEHFSIPALDNNKTPDVQLGKEIKSNKYIISEDVVLISKLNPNTKRIWKPFPQSQHPVCSTEFMVYNPKEKNSLFYVYELINSDAFSDMLVSHATGSTGSRQRVKPSDSLKFKFIQPPVSIMNQFSKVIEPIHNNISFRIIENQKLALTRDNLIPRLISGEIRVMLEN